MRGWAIELTEEALERGECSVVVGARTKAEALEEAYTLFDREDVEGAHILYRNWEEL